MRHIIREGILWKVYFHLKIEGVDMLKPAQGYLEIDIHLLRFRPDCAAVE